MRVITSLGTAVRLAFHKNAVRQGVYYSSLDISYRCEKPIYIELRGLPDPVIEAPRKAVYSAFDNIFCTQQYLLFPAKPGRHLYSIDLQVSCRRCPSCLKERGRRWSARAFHECKQSSRTWFCTFTLAPEHRLRACLLAKKKFSNEEFSSIYNIISGWFTLYLKRIRKESGAKLRFFLAVEMHADGFPHLHALIHEVGEGEVTKRTLQGQWPYGFTNVKLADPASARYVTKYLAKSLLARVRASLNYGSCVNVLTHREYDQGEAPVISLTPQQTTVL